MKNKIFSLGLIALLSATQVKAQSIDPDNTVLAFSKLEQEKNQIIEELSKPKSDKVAIVGKMLELGMWDKAISEMNKLKPSSFEYKILKADYLILNNDYKAAEVLVKDLLKTHSNNEKVIIAHAHLNMMAWRLTEAAKICNDAIKTNPSNALKMMLGKINLLQKDLKGALALAKVVQSKDPKNALAYQLEADVYFWGQKPDEAIAPLRKSLELDPLNADARFSYGYAIWRKFDATLMNAMAAQWEVALAVNPLHFSTHWHWGNGHTNLTYADYVEKDEDQVRKELKQSDVLFSQNKIQEAIDFTRNIQKKYPTSTVPKLHRASLYHAAYGFGETKVRLDSAENIFRNILANKKHYGPAHNGLSAVIKAKRIPYLKTYDSITNRLLETKITDMENFAKIFPDVKYYPSPLMKGMMWNQLNTAVVYFPFIAKGKTQFIVNPLHIDLADATGRTSFRYTTTFDNRQWMDIRGVGSGVADIGYTERGAYMERNVLLHEYVHLFHGRVLTDEENRQIRKRYWTAMREGRTLDYYSQNNESEYLAQTYPAYFEPEKVHPLDFKSMNTTAELKAKDPEMYAFLDKLVKKETAYLNGDKSAMASNWAHVYVNLSNEARRSKSNKVSLYLDTALTYDSKYLPALIAYSKHKADEKNYIEAENWLKKAESINPNYAPIYVAYADLVNAKAENKFIDKSTSIKQQAELLNKAYKMEDDYQELASINRLLREMYKKNGLISEAIETASEYVANGSKISTYLRDRVVDADIFALALKAELGYAESLEKLKYYVGQRPQNFELRNTYADALATHGKYDEAINNIKEVQRILVSTGNGRADYDLRLAMFYAASNNLDSTKQHLDLVLPKSNQLKPADKIKLANLYITLKNNSEAQKIVDALNVETDSYLSSELSLAKGRLFEAEGKQDQSIAMYEQAIGNNPYQFAIYPVVINNYKSTKKMDKVKELEAKLAALKTQPGKLFN